MRISRTEYKELVKLYEDVIDKYCDTVDDLDEPGCRAIFTLFEWICLKTGIQHPDSDWCLVQDALYKGYPIEYYDEFDDDKLKTYYSKDLDELYDVYLDY